MLVRGSTVGSKKMLIGTVVRNHIIELANTSIFLFWLHRYLIAVASLISAHSGIEPSMQQSVIEGQ